MGKLHSNQQGFGSLGLVIILVAVCIGAAGWLAYRAHHKSALPASSSSNSTAQSSKSVDPYKGWKTYCDSATNGCFRYPADWQDATPLSDQGIKASSQNKDGTITLEYTEPVNGNGGLGAFLTHSLQPLTAADDSYRVVGGYYTTGNIPGYYVVDASLATQYDLAAGRTSTIGDNEQLYFSKDASKATLVVHYNNTTGNASIASSQADAWFSSADAKTALLIAQSFYTK